MPQAVKCDVCGKLFSSSYVNSHKRLAHPAVPLAMATEKSAVQKIVDLFQKLSPEGKKKALEALTKGPEKRP